MQKNHYSYLGVPISHGGGGRPVGTNFQLFWKKRKRGVPIIKNTKVIWIVIQIAFKGTRGNSSPELGNISRAWSCVGQTRSGGHSQGGSRLSKLALIAFLQSFQTTRLEGLVDSLYKSPESLSEQEVNNLFVDEVFNNSVVPGALCRAAGSKVGASWSTSFPYRTIGQMPKDFF